MAAEARLARNIPRKANLQPLAAGGRLPKALPNWHEFPSTDSGLLFGRSLELFVVASRASVV